MLGGLLEQMFFVAGRSRGAETPWGRWVRPPGAPRTFHHIVFGHPETHAGPPRGPRGVPVAVPHPPPRRREGLKTPHSGQGGPPRGEKGGAGG